MAQHPVLPYLRSSEKGKVVSAAEAVRLIRDGDTVATGGFVGIRFAEEIAIALEELHLSTEAEPPLREIAPGIDVKRDIIAQMDFKPIVRDELELMDARIFRIEPMGLPRRHAEHAT